MEHVSADFQYFKPRIILTLARCILYCVKSGALDNQHTLNRSKGIHHIMQVLQNGTVPCTATLYMCGTYM